MNECKNQFNFVANQINANMYKSLLIILLFLTACCKDGTETSKYYLTDFEMGFIPYAEADDVAFRHSGGYEFNLNTTKRSIEFRRTPTEHCGEDYSTYETLVAELQSNSPELYIHLEHFFPVMSIEINNYYFDIDLSLEPDYDSLTVDGQAYHNVYHAESTTADSTIIRPQELYYNKESGIIQTLMTNHESYTINP